ncbi:MAG TPA: hypothetical protein VNQ73_13950 [Ilumatobacter sp.]|nr:hypothetical protein [Ilumatobacter sp.]
MEYLPTPFTAEQIRDASRGRRVRTITEAPDTEPVEQVTEFAEWETDGATMRSCVLDTDGQPVGEPTESRASWEDLRRHALFPAADTLVAEEVIAHPLGELATLRYTLDAGDRQHVFWFATAFPGMPVRYQTFVDGQLLSATTVVESLVG